MVIFTLVASQSVGLIPQHSPSGPEALRIARNLLVGLKTLGSKVNEGWWPKQQQQQQRCDGCIHKQEAKTAGGVLLFLGFFESTGGCCFFRVRNFSLQ